MVYRFTTTSCDVGLKTDILLFVLPCIFLSLYIFRQRYQPYALEALKRGIVRFSDSSSYELVSRNYELASRYNEFVSCYNELAPRYNEKVSRYND